jgi:hypothetical protein
MNQRYLGQDCPSYYRYIRLLGDYRYPRHLEEYLETGGDDWDYRGGVRGGNEEV